MFRESGLAGSAGESVVDVGVAAVAVMELGTAATIVSIS